MDTSQDIVNKLKSYISDRTLNITNDLRVFLWVRLNNYDILNDKQLKLGGGNLTMAIALFACLSYIGKIHWLLHRNIPMRKKENFIPLIDYLEYEEIGLNETDCFKFLIQRSPCKLGLRNLQQDELEKFWSSWRNSLVHMLAQEGTEGPVLSIIPKGQSHNYLMEMNKLDPELSFYLNKKKWSCRIDNFNSGLDKITQWLVGEIDKQENLRVGQTLAWVEDELKEGN